MSPLCIYPPSPCLCPPSVCMSPPYVSPLYVYILSIMSPPSICSLHVYFTSVYMSPPRIIPSACISPLYSVPSVWCPLVWMFFCLIALSCILPPFICLFCVYVTPCAYPFRIYIPPCLCPFSCVSPSVYMFLSMIAVGIRNLQIIGWRGVIMLVRLLRYVQYGIDAHI